MAMVGKAGMMGFAPAVTVKPIVRQTFTVGALKKALQDLPDDMLVCVKNGPVNKLYKDPKHTEPSISLLYIDDSGQNV